MFSFLFFIVTLFVFRFFPLIYAIMIGLANEIIGVVHLPSRWGVGVHGEWCDPHGVVDALVWWG